MLGFRVGAEIIINVLAWTSAKAHSMCSFGKGLPWTIRGSRPLYQRIAMPGSGSIIGLASGPHVGSRDAGPCLG